MKYFYLLPLLFMLGCSVFESVNCETEKNGFRKSYGQPDILYHDTVNGRTGEYWKYRNGTWITFAVDGSECEVTQGRTKAW